jgi:uncharacterized damage-inducible protein DinB
MNISFVELLRYTQEERDKWRGYFTAHPEAMDLEVQPAGGRHSTVGALIDHIFLVERRHLQRLMNEPVDTKTGLSGHHAPPLFDYGGSVRRELEQYVSDLDDDVADEPRTFTVATGDFVLTPRKLLFHCLLHETRHWAQIALALRRAGLEPPGNHDLFYSKALR